LAKKTRLPLCKSGKCEYFLFIKKRRFLIPLFDSSSFVKEGRDEFLPSFAKRGWGRFLNPPRPLYQRGKIQEKPQRGDRKVSFHRIFIQRC